MMALAEVPEAGARGRVGDIYADIRATLRVPVVNTIYRQLAVMPEALEWAWLSVRPHLLSGAVARQAEVLRRDVQRVLDVSRPAALPANVVVPLRQKRDAANVVQGYELANRMNLVCFTHLLRQPGVGRSAANQPWAIKDHTQAASGAAMLPAALPPMPELADLAPEVLARVQRLNRLGEYAEPRAVAGLYRHLAVWPQFLEAVEAWLTPWNQSGVLLKLRETALDSVARQARLHPLRMQAPDARVELQFRGQLQLFSGVVIPKMIPVGLLLDNWLHRSEAGKIAC
ncbi:hypothetical protein [Bordetella petrii]|uniref:hypothetical protein n=1 Tax=Bordetella petrii TaxID=94624 RepID=UPI001A95743D|nr:hypothetical protein [Bordetella petrii]MBO1113836.1 hypothetical protein [Bordetella petrii]